MKDEPIDRILSSEDTLLPSSGFAAAVMERIHEESVAPAPIPFPWKRIAPGIVMGFAGLGWGAVELTRMAIAAAHDTQPSTLPIRASALPTLEGLGWVALALGVSLASWMLARRIGGESRLL